MCRWSETVGDGEGRCFISIALHCIAISNPFSLQHTHPSIVVLTSSTHNALCELASIGVRPPGGLAHRAQRAVAFVFPRGTPDLACCILGRAQRPCSCQTALGRREGARNLLP